MSPDELEQLEQQLRQLPLRRPTTRLDARIASAAAPSAVAWPPRRRPAGLALAACAVAVSLLVAIVWHDDHVGPGPTADPSHPSLAASQGPAEPVRIEQVWCATSLGEVVAGEDRKPMQRLYRQVVRHVRVIDDRRNVRIEWNIPSRQSALMPLEIN